MNRLTQYMAMLGAFGSEGLKGNTRPQYEYPLRAGKLKSREKNPNHTKSGPGRRHVQGKSNHTRRMERRLRSCSR